MAYYDPVRGGLMRGFSYTTDVDGWNRIRLGYVCVMCVQPHERTYPDECSICRFPMKSLQDKVAKEKFGGYRWIGSRIDMNDELERLDTDTKPRSMHNPDAHIRVPVGLPEGGGGGIEIPVGVEG